MKEILINKINELILTIHGYKAYQLDHGLVMFNDEHYRLDSQIKQIIWSLQDLIKIYESKK